MYCRFGVYVCILMLDWRQFRGGGGGVPRQGTSGATGTEREWGKKGKKAMLTASRIVLKGAEQIRNLRGVDRAKVVEEAGARGRRGLGEEVEPRVVPAELATTSDCSRQSAPQKHKQGR